MMKKIICELKKYSAVKYAWVFLFSIFMFVLADTSFYSVNVLTGAVRLIICVLIACLMLICSKNRYVSQKQLLILFFFVCNVLISSLIYNSIKSGIIIIICMIPAFIISARCPLKLFIYAYNKILYFLSIWSLVTLLIFLFQPGIISLFPSIASDARDYQVFNLIFSVVSNNAYVIRNFGVFWEPGTFSIFLNLSLLFNLFYTTQLNKRYVFVLALAIISTMSTLGIVCMVILFISYIVNDSKVSSFRSKSIILAVSVVFLLIVVFYGQDFLYHVFNKLTDEDNESTVTRTASVLFVGRAFLENWLFGIGMDNFNILQEQRCFNMATCTPLNWIAVYGLIGFLYIIGLLKFFLKFSTNVLTKCCFILFGLLIFSTENFLQIPFIYYLVFEGYKSERITHT